MLELNHGLAAHLYCWWTPHANSPELTAIPVPEMAKNIFNGFSDPMLNCQKKPPILHYNLHSPPTSQMGMVRWKRQKEVPLASSVNFTCYSENLALTLVLVSLYLQTPDLVAVDQHKKCVLHATELLPDWRVQLPTASITS